MRKTFGEELITYFPFVGDGPHRESKYGGGGAQICMRTLRTKVSGWIKGQVKQQRCKI
jgi:hypothetical protein